MSESTGNNHNNVVTLPPRSLPPKPKPSAYKPTNLNSSGNLHNISAPTSAAPAPPVIPPRSPELQSSTSLTTGGTQDRQDHHNHHTPTHSNHNYSAGSGATPPIPPRQTNSSSSLSSSQDHNSHSGNTPPIPPRNPTQSKLSLEDIKISNSNHHQHTPPKSSTLKPTSSTDHHQQSQNPGFIPPLPPRQSSYGTYRKPLPNLPNGSAPSLNNSAELSTRPPLLPPNNNNNTSNNHIDTRHSLKNPTTNTPFIPPLPKAGSSLALVHPNNSPNSGSQNNSPPLTSSGSIEKNRKGTTKLDRDSIVFVQVEPQQSNTMEPIVSTHPSLDHLASFTSLRDLKAKEILTTERTYCDNMKILVEVFIEPLKAGEGGISKDSATIICSNLTDLLLVSVELLNRLEVKLADWSTTQRIGDVFLTLIPFLKMYTNYTVGFDNVLSIVGDCEKNSSFVAFISKCTEDPKTRKLDLRSYLIQPVQRITRYHMLLDELLKHTDPSHPDYPDLSKSLAEMKRVTNEANEAIKRSENRAKVLEIQKSFVNGDDDIVAAHRSFVYEGVLTKVCRKACKKRVVFLFSDLLVYGSSMPPKLYLHEKINLQHVRVEDIPDGDSGGSRGLNLNGATISNAFQICSNKKSFVVFADTPESKIQWLLKLTETIEALQEKKATLKPEPGKEVGGEAPIWVPDNTNNQCTLCDEPFTLFNRRHHCRSCGALICGKCSEKKFKLPITNNQAARVCNPCYEKLTAAAAAAPAETEK